MPNSTNTGSNTWIGDPSLTNGGSWYTTTDNTFTNNLYPTTPSVTFSLPIDLENYQYCFSCKQQISVKCNCLKQEMERKGLQALQYFVCGTKIHKVGIDYKNRVKLFNHKKIENLALTLAQLESDKLPFCYKVKHLIEMFLVDSSTTFNGFNSSFEIFFYTQRLKNSTSVSLSSSISSGATGSFAKSITYSTSSFTPLLHDTASNVQWIYNNKVPVKEVLKKYLTLEHEKSTK